jgi:hypothetical protein
MKKALLMLLAFLPAPAFCEWVFTPIECSQTGCMAGQGVFYNTATGEAYTLFPSKGEAGEMRPLFVKVNFLIDPPKQKAGK